METTLFSLFLTLFVYALLWLCCCCVNALFVTLILSFIFVVICSLNKSPDAGGLLSRCLLRKKSNLNGSTLSSKGFNEMMMITIIMAPKINSIITACCLNLLFYQLHQHYTVRATHFSLWLPALPLNEIHQLLPFISAIPFQHIGMGNMMWKHTESIQLILNNMAGNNVTVFQFNFIVNNLQFDFDFLPSMLLEIEMGAALAWRGGWLVDQGRNGEWHH